MVCFSQILVAATSPLPEAEGRWFVATTTRGVNATTGELQLEHRSLVPHWQLEATALIERGISGSIGSTV